MAKHSPLPVCKAISDPTREYTPDMVRDMLERRQIRTAAQPGAAGQQPPPVPRAELDSGHTLVDDDDCPTAALSCHEMAAALAEMGAETTHEEVAGMPPGSGRFRDHAGGIARRPVGRPRQADVSKPTIDLRGPVVGLEGQRQPPERFPAAIGTANGPAPAPSRRLGRGSSPPEREPAIERRQSRIPAAYAATRRAPAIPAQALAATQRDPVMVAPQPMPVYPPPGAFPEPPRQQPSGPQHNRPPSTLSDISGRRLPARETRARSTTGQVAIPTAGLGSALVPLLLAVIAGAGVYSLRLFEIESLQLIAAVAALPVLVMLAASGVVRLLSWSRVPRPLILVTAALGTSFGLLAAAFFASWSVGIGAQPWIQVDVIAQLPSELSLRLVALTGLEGRLLMGWWAALVVMVAVLASLGAARVVGYRGARPA